MDSSFQHPQTRKGMTARTSGKRESDRRNRFPPLRSVPTCHIGGKANTVPELLPTEASFDLEVPPCANGTKYNAMAVRPCRCWQQFLIEAPTDSSRAAPAVPRGNFNRSATSGLASRNGIPKEKGPLALSESLRTQLPPCTHHPSLFLYARQCCVLTRPP